DGAPVLGSETGGLGARAVPAAPTAVAAAAVATTAAAARGLRLGFVDLDLTAVERRAVQRLDGRLRLAVRGHFDKPEAFALARVAVRDQANRLDRAVRAERRAQRGIGSRIRKIADVEFSAHVPS